MATTKNTELTLTLLKQRPAVASSAIADKKLTDLVIQTWGEMENGEEKQHYIKDVTFTALKQGFSFLVISLLRCGLDKSIVDIDGHDLVTYAVRYGVPDLLLWLADANVDIIYGRHDSYNRTLLQQAAKCGFVDIVKIYVERGAPLNHKDCFGKTALQLCMEDNFYEIAIFLLENNASLCDNARDNHRLLKTAVLNNNICLVRMLLDRGIDVNYLEKGDMTVLGHALVNCHLDMFYTLIDYSAGLSHLDESGNSALHVVASRRYAGDSHLLTIPPPVSSIPITSAYINTNHGNYTAYTSLSTTLRNSTQDVYKTSFPPSYGINPDLEIVLPQNASLPLRPVATDSDTSIVVSYITEDGTAPGQFSYVGHSALEFAIRHDNVSAVRALLHAKAEVNVYTPYGETMLLYACKLGREECVRLLMVGGADPNIESVVTMEFALPVGKRNGITSKRGAANKPSRTIAAQRASEVRTAMFDNRPVLHDSYAVKNTLGNYVTDGLMYPNPTVSSTTANMTHTSSIVHRVNDKNRPNTAAFAHAAHSGVVATTSASSGGGDAVINGSNTLSHSTPGVGEAKDNLSGNPETSLVGGNSGAARTITSSQPTYGEYLPLDSGTGYPTPGTVTGATTGGRCGVAAVSLHGLPSLETTEPTRVSITALYGLLKGNFSLNTADILLRNGARVNHLARNDRGEVVGTPLTFAIQQGASLEAIVWLLRNGAMIEPPSFEFPLPLNVALECRRYDVVLTLLYAGARVFGNGHVDGNSSPMGLLSLLDMHVHINSSVEPHVSNVLSPITIASATAPDHICRLLVEVAAESYQHHTYTLPGNATNAGVFIYGSSSSSNANTTTPTPANTNDGYTTYAGAVNHSITAAAAAAAAAVAPPAPNVPPALYPTTTTTPVTAAPIAWAQDALAAAVSNGLTYVTTLVIDRVLCSPQYRAALMLTGDTLLASDGGIGAASTSNTNTNTNGNTSSNAPSVSATTSANANTTAAGDTNPASPSSPTSTSTSTSTSGSPIAGAGTGTGTGVSPTTISYTHSSSRYPFLSQILSCLSEGSQLYVTARFLYDTMIQSTVNSLYADFICYLVLLIYACEYHDLPCIDQLLLNSPPNPWCIFCRQHAERIADMKRNAVESLSSIREGAVDGDSADNALCARAEEVLKYVDDTAKTCFGTSISVRTRTNTNTNAHTSGNDAGSGNVIMHASIDKKMKLSAAPIASTMASTSSIVAASACPYHDIRRLPRKTLVTNSCLCAYHNCKNSGKCVLSEMHVSGGDASGSENSGNNTSQNSGSSENDTSRDTSSNATSITNIVVTPAFNTTEPHLSLSNAFTSSFPSSSTSVSFPPSPSSANAGPAPCTCMPCDERSSPLLTQFQLPWSQYVLAFAATHGHVGIIDTMIDIGFPLDTVLGNELAKPETLTVSPVAPTNSTNAASGTGTGLSHFQLLYPSRGIIIAPVNEWAVKSLNNATALVLASLHGQSNVVRKLISLPEPHRVKGTSVNRALLVALRDGNEEIVHMLLEAGADANYYDVELGHTVWCATVGGSVYNVQAIIQHGGDVNVWMNAAPLGKRTPDGYEGEWALAAAVRLGDDAIFKALVAAGATMRPQHAYEVPNIVQHHLHDPSSRGRIAKIPSRLAPLFHFHKELGPPAGVGKNIMSAICNFDILSAYAQRSYDIVENIYENGEPSADHPLVMLQQPVPDSDSIIVYALSRGKYDMANTLVQCLYQQGHYCSSDELFTFMLLGKKEWILNLQHDPLVLQDALNRLRDCINSDDGLFISRVLTAEMLEVVMTVDMKLHGSPPHHEQQITISTPAPPMKEIKVAKGRGKGSVPVPQKPTTVIDHTLVPAKEPYFYNYGVGIGSRGHVHKRRFRHPRAPTVYSPNVPIHSSVGGYLTPLVDGLSPYQRYWSEVMMNVVESGSPQTSRLLDIFLRCGVNINYRDEDGNTVLHTALSRHMMDIIRVLVERKADLNARNCLGLTPIMLAAREGYTDIVLQLLVDNNADVNATRPNGWSALIYAAQSGYVENVKVLLDAKADAAIVGVDGRSALCFARDGEFEDIIDLLTKDAVQARTTNLSNPELTHTPPTTTTSTTTTTTTTTTTAPPPKRVVHKGDVHLDELDTNDDLMFAIRTATEDNGIPDDDSFSYEDEGLD